MFLLQAFDNILSAESKITTPLIISFLVIVFIVILIILIGRSEPQKGIIVLKATDESMAPKISKGDTIIIQIQSNGKEGQTEIENEDIVAIYNGITKTVTCRQIERSPIGITLIALNPSFLPEFYPNSEIQKLPIYIIGKVIKIKGAD